jgi:cyclohexanone monooxygenase
MYMIGGPGSPSVLVNVIMGNEYQVAWISQMIKYMRDKGYKRVDVDPAYQAEWAQTVQGAIEGTVFTTSDSWYVGANVKGKARGILAYAGGFANYVKACDAVADNGFKGFVFT